VTTARFPFLHARYKGVWLNLLALLIK